MGLNIFPSARKNVTLVHRIASFQKNIIGAFGFKTRPSSFLKSRFLVHSTSRYFISSSPRTYSSSAFDSYHPTMLGKKEGLNNEKVKEIYNEVMKSSGEPGLKTPSLSEGSRALVKKVHPIRNSNRKDPDWLEAFVKTFPDNIDPEKLVRSFADKIGVHDITVVTYSRLIHTLGLSGQYKLAQKTFDLMQFKGLTPDEQAYHALMNAYSNGGQLFKTIEIFELLEKKFNNENPFPYGILIKAYMQHRRVQDAFKVIEKMKRKTLPNVQTYTTLIQACIKAQDNNRAWAAYEMMLRDGCQPDPIIYGIMISICQKRDVKKALDLFEELLARKFSPNHLVITSLLSALCSKPSFYPKAIELLESFTKQGTLKPDAYTFNVMIRGASLCRSLSDARLFFSKLQKLQCDPKTQLISYSTLMEAYASAFPADGTERTFESEPTETIADFSFLELPSPTCISECSNEVRKFVPFFEKSDLAKESIRTSSRPWIGFLSVLANYGYFNEAMKWFEIITNKSNQGLHCRIYSCMLEMCTRLHKEDAFFVVLKKAKGFLAPILPDSSLNSREKIEYQHMYLISPGPLGGIYQSIIVGLSRFNRPDEALRYFDFMTQDPAIEWETKEKYFKPFFDAIWGSGDSKLEAHLTQLFLKNGKAIPDKQ